MRSQVKKAAFVAAFLSAVVVVAPHLTKSVTFTFLSESGVGSNQSLLKQQPTNNAALSRIADQSLRRIEAAQAAIGAGRQYKPDKLIFSDLEIEIAKLSDQEAPADVMKSDQNPKIGDQRPLISDTYEPGITLDILQQETGLKRAELEAVLAEGH